MSCVHTFTITDLFLKCKEIEKRKVAIDFTLKRRKRWPGGHIVATSSSALPRVPRMIPPQSQQQLTWWSSFPSRALSRSSSLVTAAPITSVLCSSDRCRLSSADNAFFRWSPNTRSRYSCRSSLSVLSRNMWISDRMASRMSSFLENIVGWRWYDCVKVEGSTLEAMFKSCWQTVSRLDGRNFLNNPVFWKILNLCEMVDVYKAITRLRVI